MANINGINILNLRTKVKNEMNRRSGHGTLAGWASTSYDFTLSVKSTIGSNNEMKKIIEPILNIKDIGPGYNKIPDSNDPIVDIKALNNFIDSMATESATGATSSCRSACSGLCYGSCIGTCNGCFNTCNTGCQGCSGCSACDTGCSAQ